MKIRKHIGTFLSLILSVSIITVSLPQISYSQSSAKTTAATSDLRTRLAAIEAKVEKRRKELGIPGVSLAIVKNGKVIYSKGFGYKNFEKKVPITPDTQLAIGSATKAFTGLTVLMSRDEGKLSLDDNPQKYLPYFKINDPQTNKNIQIRDLLSHSSGLNRTDLGWVTGRLNREDIIRVAGAAKPIAGLREKFLYQNVMFLAAGMLVEKIQNQTWEEFVKQRIFGPLGMGNTTISVKQMHKAKDYSFGYSYNFDTKKTHKLPNRDLGGIAPAGAINSSANDMAKWLKFVLSKGEVDGNRLVSERGFNEWVKPQMKITPNGSVSYGFGWFVQKWNGKKVVQHGGNIDGFNSMVAMIPEEKLGFVMLTNVTASTLGNELLEVVFSGILDKKTEKPLSDQSKKEVGKYRLPQAGVDIAVSIEKDKLVAKVPGQPTYILKRISGRKYKLTNAPSGFFITFKDGEALLEQPQGNATLKKLGVTTKKPGSGVELAKELIGTYERTNQNGSIIEIKEVQGKTSLVVGNQPAYPLEKRDDGYFGSPNLPKSYYLKARRSQGGKITGFTMVQPEGEFEFKHLAKKAKASKIDISVDELIAKTIVALGGEENMRKISSRVVDFRFDAVHQGVKGYGKIYQKAPNKGTSMTTLTALGKKIGWIHSTFDGTNGNEGASFNKPDEYTGERLADVKAANDFYPFLDWKSKIEKAEIVRIGNVGKERAYVLRIKPKNANNYGLYISTKTFLPIRKVTVLVSSTTPQKIPINEYFSDYRKVDGIMIPFKIRHTDPGMGDVITRVMSVKQNVRISDKKFQN